MRPLTEPETKTLFEKLANYTGNSLKDLIAPLGDSATSDRYVFRVIKDRVYYVLLSIANLATSVARDSLASIGICLGKFTKTGKFRLHITALSILSAHARYKIWIKPNGIMPFLYGGHVAKAHVGRWTEDTPANVGVIIYDMADTPVGFGVSARSTSEARRLDPTGVVVFRQADCGEYLRDEDTLFAG
ncbi:60S ribosome subunit biogenesis protein NIP7 [Xylariaceae sp. FL0804]|nr:60S ribosome subunit biogenesis protein NIP7 [Xylariaceae sp. FL0804]